MAKWVLLAIGVLLTANGYYTRTYEFPNETPVRYCFNMDYIRIDGCFHNPTAPMLVAWLPFLIGLGLLAWSVMWGLRKAG